jgi:hypothetical protein
VVGLKVWVVCWLCAATADNTATALATMNLARPFRDILALPAEHEDF